MQIFISAVSTEFRRYRDDLRKGLTRRNVSVAVQEDFAAHGGTTLDKLDDYIVQCDAVIHLVGDMTGASPQTGSVERLLSKYPDIGARLPPLGKLLAQGRRAVSYTQWEAWLALYHRRELFVATPRDGAEREVTFQLIEAQRAGQQDHLARLRAMEKYPEISFANSGSLLAQLFKSSLFELLAEAHNEGSRVQTYRELPSRPPIFIGRDGLNQRIRQLLDLQSATVVPAVALQGMGGIGKSALAVCVAHEMAYAFPGGCLYFALGANTSTPQLARSAMQHWLSRHGFDVAKPLRDSDLQGLYQDTMDKAAGPILVVVDDPQSATDAAFLAPRHGAILVTTRRSFAGFEHVDVASLTLAESEALLRAACPRITAQDPVRELAVLCTGLPLALHAAGRTLARRRSKPVDEYVAELRRDRLTKLSEGGRDSVQFNVQLVLGNSLRSLDMAELSALRAVSVLATSFSRSAGIQVGRCSGDTLDALVESSLLSYDEVHHRFSMHDLVRELVTQAFSKSAYAHALSLAASHYSAVARQADKDYCAPEQSIRTRGLSDFDRERAGIEQALAHLRSSPKFDSELCALLNETPDLFYVRFAPEMRVELYSAGTNSARRIGRADVEAAFLGNVGVSWIRSRKPERAIKSLQRALAIALREGNLQGACSHSMHIGVALEQLNDVPRSRSKLEEALDLSVRARERKIECLTRGNLGEIYRRLNLVDESREFLQVALRMTRQLPGMRYQEGEVQAKLAKTYLHARRPRRGAGCARVAWRIARELKEPFLECAALIEFGNCAAPAGHRDAAEDALAEAQAICEAQGYEQLGVQALRVLGTWLVEHQVDRARQMLRLTIQRGDAIDAFQDVAIACGVLSDIEADPSSTANWLQQSATAARQAKEKELEVRALARLLQDSESLGRVETAAKCEKRLAELGARVERP